MIRRYNQAEVRNRGTLVLAGPFASNRAALPIYNNVASPDCQPTFQRTAGHRRSAGQVLSLIHI